MNQVPHVAKVLAFAQLCAENGDVEQNIEFKKRFGSNAHAFASLQTKAAEAHLQAIEEDADLGLKLNMLLDFDLNGVRPEAIIENLHAIGDHAYAQGLFTQATDAELASFYSKAVVSPSSGQPSKLMCNLTIAAFYSTDGTSLAAELLRRNLDDVARLAVADGRLTYETPAEVVSCVSSVSTNEEWAERERTQPRRVQLVEPDRDRNLQLASIYMFQGFMTGNPANRDAEAAGGELGLIDYVADYASIVASLVNAADAHQYEYSGVFEYEVTETLGKWLCDQGDGISKKDFGVELLRQAKDFFGNQPVEPLAEAVAARIGVPVVELQAQMQPSEKQVEESSLSMSF